VNLSDSASINAPDATVIIESGRMTIANGTWINDTLGLLCEMAMNKEVLAK